MCLTCALGCIIGSVLTNMPFIIAPPTGVSIFLSVFIQQQNMTRHDGNVATIVAGAGLLALGIYRPLGTFITRVSYINQHYKPHTYIPYYFL
jgi:xanthine/uracil/vitamin C permease (AzgA family)